MFPFLARAFKGVAAGKAQANLGVQSPDLPNAVTRIGRFLYVTSGLWIVVAWYSGYVNERTEPGSGPKLVLAGKRINPPDRPDRTPQFSTSITSNNQLAAASSTGFVDTTASNGTRTLIALSPNQLGVPGSAIAGYLWSAPNKDKQFPSFDRNRYQLLLGVANKIAVQFGLKITSGYRPQSTGSLHGSGLAFDMVGAMSNMKRAATWASQNPAMFQEIFIHNEGSGVHLHLGFYPNAAAIYTAAANRMSRPAAGRH